MARSLKRLEELGARVASILKDTAPERAGAIDDARRGFLRHQSTPRDEAARVFGLRLSWVGGAAAIAAFAAAVLVLIHRQVPITFDVDDAVGVAKIWLAAPEASPLRLQFSEGTNLRLEAAARARVADIDAHGASLTLERGRLHAEVVHKAGSAWKVVAGPFTVNVTGTVFDVSWDPSSEQLAVAVGQGSVSVRDSSTGVERTVLAPQTLRASGSEHRFAVAQSNVSAEPASAPHARAKTAEAAESSAPEPASGDARDAASIAPDGGSEPLLGRGNGSVDAWRDFAKRGALREAFSSAEAAGFTRTCASASPAELLLLGDGARLSGKAERAVEALLTLRRRFPADPRRAAAAFALGKVAFDQRGAYEQAAEWFSTSLREQPGGPLAREASGRLIEALRRADDSAGARRAAREYLSKYPEGPHADLARSVLR